MPKQQLALRTQRGSEGAHRVRFERDDLTSLARPVPKQLQQMHSLMVGGALDVYRAKSHLRRDASGMLHDGDGAGQLVRRCHVAKCRPTLHTRDCWQAMGERCPHHQLGRATTLGGEAQQEPHDQGAVGKLPDKIVMPVAQ